MSTISGKYEVKHDLSNVGTDQIAVGVTTVDQAGAYGMTQHYATMWVALMDYDDKAAQSVVMKFTRAGLEKVIAEAQRLLDEQPAKEFAGIGPRGHGS